MHRVVALFALLGSTSLAAAVPRPADTPLHGYVLGRFAAADDKLGEAARYYEAARLGAPADPLLARRAFDLALAAGDKRMAIALADQLAATPQADATIALIRVADAIERRDWKAADAARANIADAGYAAVVGPVIEAWTLFGRGKRDEALAKLDPLSVTGFARGYIGEQRAHMLAAANRPAEAALAYAQLLAGATGGINFLRVGEADALQRAGRADEAAKLLAAAPAEPAIVGARARLAAGRRIGALAPSPGEGIGWLFARLAVDLARDKPVNLALVFARAATFVAPDIAATWLIAGDVLARGERGVAALDAYARVPDADPLATAARARRAAVLADSGADDAALNMLRTATASPAASADDWARLADWYRKADRHREAADAYARAIDAAAANSGGTPWSLLFLRGSSREQAGDWAGAEPDLRAALAAAPDEPTVLNYLGYSLLDRGLALAEAQTLIERAAKLRPDDGFITDSLGWAYFRTGQFAQAVTVLERAVASEPGDPTINEHLGDAYWRVGRRIEARFRWRATLDLQPSPAQAKSVGAKLDYGLDVASAMIKATPR